MLFKKKSTLSQDSLGRKPKRKLIYKKIFYDGKHDFKSSMHEMACFSKMIEIIVFDQGDVVK